MAIGEKLQACLDVGECAPAWELGWDANGIAGDQLCGVGLSVRFNSHLISVWHRDASKQSSIDAILATVLEELPVEMKPKSDNYFYKKHSDHAGFKAPETTSVPVPAIQVPKA